MQKSKRLQVIAKVALWREQKQQHELKQAHMRLSQQAQSLTQLNNYQQEYLSAAPASASTSVSMASVTNFSRFMRDLSHACKLQTDQFTQAKTAFQEQEQAWQRLHARTHRLESMVAQAEKVEDRQREIDQELEIADNWASRRISAKNQNE